MQKCSCLYYISSLNIIWSSVHRSHSTKCPDLRQTHLLHRVVEFACRHFGRDGFYFFLPLSPPANILSEMGDGFYFFVSLRPTADTLGAITSTSSCR